MQVLALVCLALAAAAVAKPQNYRDGVTTVTERTYTIGRNNEADKYYSNAGVSYYGNANAYGNAYTNYGYGYQPYAYSALTPSVARYNTYYQHAAPAVSYHHTYHHAAPAVSYSAVTAAPAVSYSAAPAVSYAAAPAVSYETATAAPVVSYQTATAAPAVVSYQTANVAPVVSYQAVAAPAVYGAAEAETKVFKHVYAFAAPEEPAQRAVVRVDAPVSKRKHYKLVFIKAPGQQTVVDSDITLPAHEEEKTLIYVLSKNQKQVQPQIRIKQAEASKHAKPEVFFLKYKNEAEAQAIASDAISGQTANIPAEGEIISDGSVSLLGQQQIVGGAGAGAAFGSDAFGYDAFEGLRVAQQPQPLLYRKTIVSSQPAISTVSAGSVGILPSNIVSAPVVNVAPAVTTVSPATVYTDGAAQVHAQAYGSAFSYGRSIDNEEPLQIKVTSEPSDVVETSTPTTLAL